MLLEPAKQNSHSKLLKCTEWKHSYATNIRENRDGKYAMETISPARTSLQVLQHLRPADGSSAP